MDNLILPALLILFIWLCCLNNEVYKIKAALEQLNTPRKKGRQNKAAAASKQEKITEQTAAQVPQKILTSPVPQAPVVTQTESADFENLFLGNIFNKIGAVA